MTNREELQKFKTEALRLLKEASGKVGFDWLKEPGDLIQCRPEALLDNHADFYFMGFNPGGDRGLLLSETIARLDLPSSVEHPLSQAPEKQYWARVCRLAAALEVAPEDLFITNLFPDSATGVSEWKRNKHEPACAYVEAIWPLHESMLSLVRPRFVIVSGIRKGDSAFKYLWDMFQSNGSKISQHAWNDTMSPITKGDDPQVKSFSIGDLSLRTGKSLPRVTFIGVKHFSWGGPRSPRTVRNLVDHERQLARCVGQQPTDRCCPITALRAR